MYAPFRYLSGCWFSVIFSFFPELVLDLLSWTIRSKNQTGSQFVILSGTDFFVYKYIDELMKSMLLDFDY